MIPRANRPWQVASAAGLLIAAMLMFSAGCGSQPDPIDEAVRLAASSSAPASQPLTTSQPAGPFRPPEPPGARDRIEERNRMVDTQIARPRDGRTPVRDAKVLQAMRTVPRHVFVSNDYQSRAYGDSPLPIGHGQTISQPYIVALMTEALQLTPEMKVLEIGTGSGYQAAVLAHLTPHVYTIEIVRPLAQNAQRVLLEQGYNSVRCRIGDGYKGWPEEAPFDVIIVTCAAENVPAPLWEQLKPGGRIVIPTGSAWGAQELVVVTKTPDGKQTTRHITGVRFVPMTRE
ncbi:MAG: protein-L-isoaspartate(D-aspartate) O-methyltransferase [Phycisphaerae bacterium]